MVWNQAAMVVCAIGDGNELEATSVDVEASTGGRVDALVVTWQKSGALTADSCRSRTNTAAGHLKSSPNQQAPAVEALAVESVLGPDPAGD